MTIEARPENALRGSGRQVEESGGDRIERCKLPDERLEPLITGYRRFRASGWLRERERFELTAEHGQQPHTLVIACSDSRVDPQMILNAHPGELFVVRNVANLVPPCEADGTHHGTSAAIEFAVRVLGVERILVLGHGMCGGVKMLLEDDPPAGFDFATRWMDLASAAKLATGDVESPGCPAQGVRRSDRAPVPHEPHDLSMGRRSGQGFIAEPARWLF